MTHSLIRAEAVWLTSAIVVAACVTSAGVRGGPGDRGGAGGGSGSGGAGGGAGSGAGDSGQIPTSDATSDAGPLMAPQPISPYVVVDQFGYRPLAEKLAVLRQPQSGFDAPSSFTPGAKYALVDAHTGQYVLQAAPTAWHAGATDASSGDKAWWFDFSAVATPGDYFVLDEAQSIRSDVFAISDTVYRDVLTQAVRMLFYQRDGFAKTAQFAGAGWADGAAHMGALQDPHCRLTGKSGDATTEKDLHGGWFDAGDENKYTSFGAVDVIDFLHAYTENPNAFRDDDNIPESGNGIPDLIDEAKWELDWLLRMQNADGSVLSIVGEDSASPPSAATKPSVYGPATTGASVSAAAAFAYASMVFASVSPTYAQYAGQLRTAALGAWTWAHQNPGVTFYNSAAGVGAGEQELVEKTGPQYNLPMRRLEAAVYLFELTGDTTYRDDFDANYMQAHLFTFGNYVDPYSQDVLDGLLEYTKAPGATASVAQNIKNAYKAGMQSSDNFGSLQSNADPYLAYIHDYVWGNNATKSRQGTSFYAMVTFGIDSTTNADAERAAERYVHYIHGVNPLQLVYLSHMGDFGARKSVTRFFHSWFSNSSPLWNAVGVSTYGPPPGFLVGGANHGYSWDGCCPSTCGVSCGAAPSSPPAGQPPQKAYKDWNDNRPQDSWEVSEPDDGYQSAYVRLLSKFVK